MSCKLDRVGRWVLIQLALSARTRGGVAELTSPYASFLLIIESSHVIRELIDLAKSRRLGSNSPPMFG